MMLERIGPHVNPTVGKEEKSPGHSFRIVSRGRVGRRCVRPIQRIGRQPNSDRIARAIRVDWIAFHLLPLPTGGLEIPIARSRLQNGAIIKVGEALQSLQ